MSLFANDIDMSVANLSIDDKPSEANGESALHVVGSNSSASPPNDGNSSEVDTESATYTVKKMENPPNDGISSEVDNESGTYTVKKLGTSSEADKGGATYTVSKRSMEEILKDQTEETRLNLISVAEDTENMLDARAFAVTASDIVELWQIDAEEKNPTSHQIDFGVGSPINLLMVLALLPEKYQEWICIRDKHRSPFENGENLSWLHEQSMDVLVGLSIDPAIQPIVFAPGLASMIRDDVDEGWRVFTGRSWLEDQLHLLSNDKLETDLYRFPPATEKIVFFFNPTEIHWTVIEVELRKGVWTYTLYNSLYQGDKGPSWRACQEQLPLLEQLICRASGFAEPSTREITSATSAQQENSYDCGPIAIYNATELLQGRKPESEVDTEELRLTYLTRILAGIHLLYED